MWQQFEPDYLHPERPVWVREHAARKRVHKGQATLSRWRTQGIVTHRGYGKNRQYLASTLDAAATLKSAKQQVTRFA